MCKSALCANCNMYNLHCMPSQTVLESHCFQYYTAYSSIALRYTCFALCTNGTVCNIARNTNLHCVQSCTVFKIALCTAHKSALCTLSHSVHLYCAQHCTVYNTLLCKKLHCVPKQIFLGCGHFGSPSLSCSRAFTLPDSSTCASATQLSIA